MKKQCDNLAQSTLVVSCGLLAGSLWTVAHAAPEVAKASRPMAAGDVQEAMHSRKAQVALARGRQLLRSGIDTLAEQQLRDAVRWAPRSIEAHRELAFLLSGRQQWPEAAAQWREVMRLSRGGTQAKLKYFGEAQREWRRATGHLAAFWDTPNIVTLGVDTRNPVVGKTSRPMVQVRSTAMLQPPSQRRATVGHVLDRQSVWVQRITREVINRDGLRLYVGNIWKAAEQFEPAKLLKAAQVKPLTRSERRTALQVRTRHFAQVQWREAVAIGGRLPERQAARIALLRAQQLEAYGVELLAEQQLQQAVAAAPDWWEVQRAMARWQSRSEQWEAAVETWQKVLSAPNVVYNPRLQAEAKTYLQQARQASMLGRLARQWEQMNVVSLGASSRSQSFRSEGSFAALQVRQSMAMMRPPALDVAKSQPATVNAKRYQFSFKLPGALEATLAAQMRIEPMPVSSTEHTPVGEPKS